MAPELLDGRPFNKSVDVYAFGIVLYEVGMTVGLCHIAQKSPMPRSHTMRNLSKLHDCAIDSTHQICEKFRGRADVLRVCFNAWGGVRS
jgi:serine/threonine protein kinase